MPPKPRIKVRGLYLKHGLYVYQPPQKNGVRPPRIHLSTSDIAEAMGMVEDIKQRNFTKANTDPVGDLVSEYIKSKSRRGDHKPKTTRNATAPLNRFKAHFRTRPSTIRPADIVVWKTSMMDEGLSRASVASYLRYAQSFLSWLKDEGHILQNPFDKLPKDAFPKSIPTRREQFCTKELRDRLIANCDYPPLKAVLFVGFHAGLRRNEILNIRPSWIIRDPDSGRPTHFHIQNETGKDGTTPFTIKDNEAKQVPISDPLADFLLNDHGIEHSPYLIKPDVAGGRAEYRWDWKKRWKHYMETQGCPWVTAHTMRHTFITLLLSAPPDRRPSLLHLERWTGTSTEVLKDNYAHLIEDRDLINAAN